MKIKTLLSTLILLAFAIIGGGSIDGEEITIYIVLLIVFVSIIAIVSSVQNKKSEKIAQQQKEKRLKELENIAIKYSNDKKTFISENGIPDKTIILKEQDLTSEINVYEDKKIVFILGKKYHFNDIMSCTFTDNPRTIKGKISSVTSSDTGSTIGRSIVGGVIAGPAGAIIGGTTLEKHTEYKQGDDITIHDYTVIININSIKEPIIRINTGDNGRLTNEIVGLMKVIIARK